MPDASPGASDAPLAAFTVLGRWPTVSDGLLLELTYRVEGSADEVELLRPAVRAAADVWSSSEAVRLRPARADEVADVRFSFESGKHGSCAPFGRDSTLAHAGSSAPPTFVHFDRAAAWTQAPEGPVLAAAAAHELGHVLGLGHSADPDALMFAEPGAARVGLSGSDHAALHSLYGGGEDRPGDVEIRDDASGTVGAVLRQVAPRERTDLGVIDTDADGDEELLVWRTDEAGYGSLMIYHFASGPRLARTVGPLPGVALPGAPHLLAETAEQERLFVSLLDDGRWLARSFDAQGLPRSRGPGVLQLGPWRDLDGDGSWDERPAEHGGGAEAWTADLDGDGTRERLTRR